LTSRTIESSTTTKYRHYGYNANEQSSICAQTDYKYLIHTRDSRLSQLQVLLLISLVRAPYRAQPPAHARPLGLFLRCYNPLFFLSAPTSRTSCAPAARSGATPRDALRAHVESECTIAWPVTLVTWK
jgi:hypothetical protein